jgi:hypothetical protein
MPALSADTCYPNTGFYFRHELLSAKTSQAAALCA